MTDVKSTIAKNIAELRLLNEMTQADLAEKLNYSDKTVSKWERGESTPDISILVEIAEIFDVSLDYLIGMEDTEEKIKATKKTAAKYNHTVITAISVSLVWLIALLAFVITTLITEKAVFQWLFFMYSVPISAIIWLVFNSIWFNPRHNYFIISILVWSLLVAIHSTFLIAGKHIGLIYLLGVVGQIIIILWSFVKKVKTP